MVAKIGFGVCGWIEISECCQGLAGTFICGLQLKKWVHLGFLPRNICAHTADVVANFMAVANYTNPSTEIQSNVIETQIVEV